MKRKEPEVCVLAVRPALFERVLLYNISRTSVHIIDTVMKSFAQDESKRQILSRDAFSLDDQCITYCFTEDDNTQYAHRTTLYYTDGTLKLLADPCVCAGPKFEWLERHWVAQTVETQRTDLGAKDLHEHVVIEFLKRWLLDLRARHVTSLPD
jgi:hypothetical protein